MCTQSSLSLSPQSTEQETNNNYNIICLSHNIIPYITYTIQNQNLFISLKCETEINSEISSHTTTIGIEEYSSFLLNQTHQSDALHINTKCTTHLKSSLYYHCKTCRYNICNICLSTHNSSHCLIDMRSYINKNKLANFINKIGVNTIKSHLPHSSWHIKLNEDSNNTSMNTSSSCNTISCQMLKIINSLLYTFTKYENTYDFNLYCNIYNIVNNTEFSNDEQVKINIRNIKEPNQTSITQGDCSSNHNNEQYKVYHSIQIKEHDFGNCLCKLNENVMFIGMGKTSDIWVYSLPDVKWMDILKGNNMNWIVSWLTQWNIYTKVVEWIAITGEGSIRRWDTGTNKCIQTLRSHHNTVNVIVPDIWNGNRSYLISCSYDKSIIFWELNRESNMYTVYKKIENWHDDKYIRALIPFKYHNENGNKYQMYASGGEDNCLRIWDFTIQTKKDVITWVHSPNSSPISSLIQLKDGRLIIGTYGNIYVYEDIVLFNLFYSFKETHLNERINCLKELENGNIVSCCYDNTIKVFNTKTFECWQTLSEHKSSVYDWIEITKDVWVSTSWDRTIKIYQK